MAELDHLAVLHGIAPSPDVDDYSPSSAAADQASLVRLIKCKLKKIQYRPHLITGCLAATGVTIEPW